jgi:anaerobic selenocysteine-containing dehydrogenase
MTDLVDRTDADARDGADVAGHQVAGSSPTGRPTGERTVLGTCHHDCPDSCGWQVTVRDDARDAEGGAPGAQAVQLRGNPAHPFGQGELCPKVNRFLDRVYSPDRVLHPLRRVGPKGEGHFEEITWDVALAEIAARLHAAIDAHGAETVMPYSDAGNQSALAMYFPQRFWNRLGGSNLLRAICGNVAGEGTKITNGTGRGLDPSELRHSKLILLWGTNTRLTNRHLWPVIEAARANGAQVVVIDPIRTATADAADWFVQPFPGTDVALMLAMIHVLIRDGLVDRAWVDAHALGFDELAEHVLTWTPERAAEVCGVPATEIERLATAYGTIRPAAIRTLIGAEHHENGAMFFRTLACLPALVGAWQHRGGGMARSVGAWSDGAVDERALSRPELRQGRMPRWLNMSRLGEILDGRDEHGTALDPPITAMIVWSSNPMVITPNAELIRRGMARDDLFTVVHEQFLTDTARYADIVLPATTQIEVTDVVTSWGHLYVGWNEAAIAPRGEAVSNSELHRRLAHAMGFTEAVLFDEDETALADAMPTIDVAELRRTGFVRTTAYPADGRPFGDGVFPTPSGKVELVSAQLAHLGQPVLPTFVAPRESPLGDLALAARFPLRLLTPKRHTRFLNSSYSQLPKHGPLEGSPYVELDAADAVARGIVDGDLVAVRNDRATLTLVARLSDRLRPGVVAIPFGWWRSQHGDGHVANSLTNDTLTEWGGGVAYSDTLVEIARLDDPVDVDGPSLGVDVAVNGGGPAGDAPDRRRPSRGPGIDEG